MVASAAVAAVAVAEVAATAADAEARVALAAAPVVVVLTVANPAICPVSGCIATLLAYGRSAGDGTVQTLTQTICIAWVFSYLCR